MAKEDLFEGIQILSAQEIEQTLSSGGESTDDNNSAATAQDDNFEIVQVNKEVVNTEDTPPVDKVITPSEVSDNTPPAESKTESVYKALIKEMVKEGVLTVEDEAELESLPGTKDSLKKLLEQTASHLFEKKQEDWKKSLPGAKKRFLEIEDAFDEADKAIFAAQRLEALESITEDVLKENVDYSKRVYYDQLTSLKKFSHEEALEAIADAEAVGKLETKALQALPDLKAAANKEVEEGKAYQASLKEQASKKVQETFEKLTETIDKKDYFIDGLNLNKIQKDKLKANITTPVYKDESGKEYTSLAYKQLKNPIEFEMLINHYDTLGLFNIDKDGNFKPDITKIKAVAKTQAVSELDKVIAQQEQRGVGRNTSVESTDKQQKISSILERAFDK